MIRVAVIVTALAGSAHAERAPVVTLAGGLALRFSGHDVAAAERSDSPDVAGDGRLTLSFEDRPIPLQAYGVVKVEGRVVPELFAGLLAGSQIGEAYAGAGLRGELAFGGEQVRITLYLAARALVIGEHRDGVAEGALGGYVTLRGGTRIGIEEGVDLRPRDHVGDGELDIVPRVFVGWALR